MNTELTQEEQDYIIKIASQEIMKHTLDTPLGKLALRERTLKYYKDLLETRDGLMNQQGIRDFNQSKIVVLNRKLDELANDL